MAPAPGEAPDVVVRLLGSGAGRRGLSALPSFDRFGILVPAWGSLEDARRFLDASPWMRAYQARAVERLDLFLLPVSGHGRWDGDTPFQGIDGVCPFSGDRAGGTAEALDGAPLAVLTRATLRPRTLASFFRASARIEGDLERCGALLAMGLGELPWVRQATFSVWPSFAAMRRFAYEEPAHREAVRLARAKGWFTEDLFVRFRLLAARGRWEGRDPFAGLDLPGLPDGDDDPSPWSDGSRVASGEARGG